MPETPEQSLRRAAERHPLYKTLLQHNGKIVIGKGSKKPGVLFVGEAPGFDEIAVGKPFVGRSGQLLDKWIESAKLLRYAVINTVPLIPLDEAGKIRAPTDDEIEYFRPHTEALIKQLSPNFIFAVGKSAAKFLKIEPKLNMLQDNKIFLYHPAYHMRNGNDGVADFKSAWEIVGKQFVEEIVDNRKDTSVVKDFVEAIGGATLDDKHFSLQDKKWFVDYHPFEHSDDIIVHEGDATSDFYLLVKTGSDKTRIVGWCSHQQLTSTPARDIYRTGKNCYVVHDTNINKLTSLALLQEKQKKRLSEFVVNQQAADNAGHTEMISGVLAGLHTFCKKAKIYFKDVNQRDICIIGDKTTKIYTREAQSDNDMLIYERDYQRNPDVDYYICCKIKAGHYNYVGYVTKAVVQKTRVVKMIGADTDKESNDLRRIFAEQYQPLTDLFDIWEEETEKEEPIIPQSYVPLHQHSEYSVGDAFGKIPYICDALKKRGFSAAALTDHGTMAGCWQFQKEMLTRDLQPITGCEIYTKLSDSEKRFHTIVLVKNEAGWKNLLAIQSNAVREHFYKKPVVPWDNLMSHHEGLIITSGCMSSPIPVCLDQDQDELAEQLVKQCVANFGDDFYLEFQPNDVLQNRKIMQKLWTLKEKFNLKAIVSTDSHYPYPEDKKYHEAIKSIGFNKPYGKAGYDDDCFFLMKDEELKQRLSEKHPHLVPHYEELAATTREIAAKCQFKIAAPSVLETLPKFDCGDFQGDQSSFLRKIANEGLISCGLSENPVYRDRLLFELDRIVKKGYTNYFLIVWDMIKFCKRSDIMVGPGRGSVGASLVAYCLGITTVDPIEHDLLFDRFISEIRKDIVDIDLDFQDNRRDEVYEYFSKKYGAEHCAKIATYARFHAKGVLRDTGRIFDIPFPETERIAGMVLERSGGDARASFSLLDTFGEFAEAKQFQERYPEASDIAVKLEGHVRHKSVHAAAIVISEDDVSSYAPIARIKDEIALEWQKQECEDMKLVKFDILGLKTLTVLQEACSDAKIQLPRKFDDAAVFRNVFQSDNTAGVFQFECLSGDTRIGPRAHRTIKQMFEKGAFETYSLFPDNKFRKNKILAIKESGIKRLYKVKTGGGKEIKVSAEHPFLTQHGWKKCKDLEVGDKVAVAKTSVLTAEKRKVLSEKQKKNWRNKKYRKKMCAKISDATSKSILVKISNREKVTDSFRKKRSKIQKKLWKDPDYKRQHLLALSFGIAKSKKFSKSIAESNSKRNGEKHWHWRGGISARRFPTQNEEYAFMQSFKEARLYTLKRDKFRCRHCNISQKESMVKFGRYLETHHKKPVRTFISENNFNLSEINAKRNLITLCASCHKVEEYETEKKFYKS